MGGRGSGRSRHVGKNDPLFDFERTAYEEILKRIPSDQLVTGMWKVHQERPGKNGGTLESYIGRFEWDPEADLEEELRTRFAPSYGGGVYKLKFFDSERRRVDAIPEIRIVLPGSPSGVDTEGSGGAAGATAGAPDPVKAEQEQGRLLSQQLLNAQYRKQLEKLDKDPAGEKDDPVRVAMGDFLRAQINGNGQKNGTGGLKELLELKMMMNALKDDPPAAETSIDKAMGGIMTAVSGLVQSQASMAAQQMQALNGLVTTSVQLMSTMQGMGAQDPWSLLIQNGPDLLDKLGGFVAGTIREVKDSYLDVKADQAGEALEAQGRAKPANGRPGLAAPKRPAPGGGRRRNEFIDVVYENFQRQVPPEVCAEQVQYYLSEMQLKGVVTAPAEKVIEFLEKQGLERPFREIEGLKQYVLEVVRGIQEIAGRAAAERAPAAEEPPPAPPKEATS